MKQFTLVISSPDGEIFRGDVYGISLRGAGGDLGVLAGHIPLITTVLPCDVKIDINDEHDSIGHTGGGMLTVGTDKVTLLTGDFEWIQK